MPTILTSPNSNPFCVPAALAALTGLHVDECVVLLKEDIGEQPITGVFYPLILKHLGKLGYLFREVRHVDREGTFLLVYRVHVGVVENSVYIDNQYPRGIAYQYHSSRRIQKAFQIFAPPPTATTKEN